MARQKKIFAIDAYTRADELVNPALRMMDAVWSRKMSGANMCRPKLSKKVAMKTIVDERDSIQW